MSLDREWLAAEAALVDAPRKAVMEAISNVRRQTLEMYRVRVEWELMIRETDARARFEIERYERMVK